ncbi:unnamed protein product [Chironomus riparius]|uniref:Ragulator complex protein LAMTOR2 homolog n=1 Tax=Chironomus riparius TaxID=315576 RepID=A0A9N9WPT8_9DIPT|nr:unnamed protein product [Chironomus riparius]
MLKPKVLTNVLSQANTGGVENTLLLNNDGALLAFSGFHNKDARITSAIASNVWSAYEKHGHNSFREDPLQFLIINCEGGNVIVTQVANLLLCLYANTDNLGILKTKISKLKEKLEIPLQSIQT